MYRIRTATAMSWRRNHLSFTDLVYWVPEGGLELMVGGDGGDYLVLMMVVIFGDEGGDVDSDFG